MPTVYSVMWDDVFLTSNTVSYEHKSLILDKPFCCLLKCLWWGEQIPGDPTNALDVGRVGGFCRITARAGWGTAGLHPGQLCRARAHGYPVFWIDDWIFSLLPPLLWLEVLLLLPRTGEKLENTFNTSVAVGSQGPVGVCAVRKKTAVLAILELTL